MATVGIITNTAAQIAQTNLVLANNQLQSSITRLSSGNAIAQASDDVAGLAVGTILQSNVITLKSSLTNAAQAGSMLGVADGALANIGSILQRQKALTAQATSGSLSDTARGYLNLEFQSLTQEIDRISSNTNFNGINLIDGSLYAPAPVKTSVTNAATQAAGQMTLAVAVNNSKSIFINGATINFNATTARSNLSMDLQSVTIDSQVNTTTSAQTQALYTVIQNALNYTGTVASILTMKQQLSQLTYTYTANSNIIGVTAVAGGVYTNGSASGTLFSIGSNNGTATDLLVNGGNAGNKTVSTSIGIGYLNAANNYVPATVAVDGDLSAGSFATGTAYGGNATTIAQGTIGDSILTGINTTTQANTGVDLSQISNNPAFVGTIKGFKASYVANNLINAQIQVGNVLYQADDINTNFAAATAVTFKAVAPGGGVTTANGGTFTLNFATNNINVSGQADADTVATRLNDAFSSVQIFQKRTIQNYSAAGTIYGTPGGSATGDLAGSSFKLINSNFSDLAIQNVSVTAPVQGAANAVISIKINGETYTSGYDSAGAVAALGTSLSAGSFGFVSEKNPKNMLVFKYTSGTALDLSTAVNAQAAQAAFTNAFGINSGATNLEFQVGTSASDNIAVQIKGTNSNSIFVDSNGNAVTPDISTQAGAISASNTLNAAIGYVTSVRANVGALESRFNYATANLNSAIQNQDAARGVFLDTDVSKEATNFAQEQVRLQASISVLAQANQLPQNLLKLIQ